MDRDFIHCFQTGTLRNGSVAAVGCQTGDSSFLYRECLSDSTPPLRFLLLRYGHSMNGARFFGQRPLGRYS